MNPTFTFEAFSAAAKAQEQHAGMALKDGEPVFTLQSHGQTRELSTTEAIDFLEQFEAAQSKEPELHEVITKPGRPKLERLGAVLEYVTECWLKPVTAIGGFSASQWGEIQPGITDFVSLGFSAATAPMQANHVVEVVIEAETPKPIVLAILRAILSEVEKMPTLEPFTPAPPPRVPMGDIDDLPF